MIENERVSHSRIQAYKSCRRMYMLKYIEKLIPTKTPDALERGRSYHEKIEQILETGGFERDENVKTNAMARAFLEYIFPRVFATDVEEWVEYQTLSGHMFHGRLDGRCGTEYIVEHKSTSSDIDEMYISRLEFDEQIKSYMLATGVHDMKYTVCKTPTIRQKQNETEEEFEERCLSWYADDPESRIRVIDIHFDDDELAQYADELDKTIDEMKNCHLFYRNTKYCTMWGRPCEYAAVCGHYDPQQEYIGYIRKE